MLARSNIFPIADNCPEALQLRRFLAKYVGVSLKNISILDYYDGQLCIDIHIQEFPSLRVKVNKHNFISLYLNDEYLYSISPIRRQLWIKAKLVNLDEIVKKLQLVPVTKQDNVQAGRFISTRDNQFPTDDSETAHTLRTVLSKYAEEWQRLSGAGEGVNHHAVSVDQSVSCFVMEFNDPAFKVSNQNNIFTLSCRGINFATATYDSVQGYHIQFDQHELDRGLNPEKAILLKHEIKMFADYCARTKNFNVGTRNNTSYVAFGSLWQVIHCNPLHQIWTALSCYLDLVANSGFCKEPQQTLLRELEKLSYEIIDDQYYRSEDYYPVKPVQLSPSQKQLILKMARGFIEAKVISGIDASSDSSTDLVSYRKISYEEFEQSILPVEELTHSDMLVTFSAKSTAELSMKMGSISPQKSGLIQWSFDHPIKTLLLFLFVAAFISAFVAFIPNELSSSSFFADFSSAESFGLLTSMIFGGISLPFLVTKYVNSYSGDPSTDLSEPLLTDRIVKRGDEIERGIGQSSTCTIARIVNITATHGVTKKSNSKNMEYTNNNTLDELKMFDDTPEEVSRLSCRK